MKAGEGKLITIVAYVDDLILTSDDEEEIRGTRENISICFQMKKLGQLNHFFVLEVDRIEEGVFLCQ